MKAIFKRELKSFFLTGTGYVFLGVFMLLSGLVFFINNVLARSSDPGGFFSMVSYIWMLLSPIPAMRLAGDRKQKTDQLLWTSPVSSSKVVLSKFLAALTVLLLALVLSLIYPALISVYGEVYLPEIIAGYLGLALHGTAFLAFDLMISSFAGTPASAYVLSLGANLLLWLSGLAVSSVKPALIRNVFALIDIYKRFVPFSMGLWSKANTMYYLLFSTVCLVAAMRLAKGRRWNPL